MDEDVVNESGPTKQHLVRPATQADLPQIAHIARLTWDATYNKTIAPENRQEFLARAYKPENLADGIDRGIRHEVSFRGARRLHDSERDRESGFRIAAGGYSAGGQLAVMDGKEPK